MEFKENYRKLGIYLQVEEKLKSKNFELEEIDKKISAEIGKAFVSKADFNAKNEEKKAIAEQLENANKQIEEFKGMDIDGIKKAADDWKLKAEQAQKDAEAKITAMQFDHALDGALSGAKAKNAKAVKALLDMEGLKMNNGEIVGLNEQLEKVKEENGYLFDDDTAEQKPKFAGTTPGASTPALADGFIASARKAAGLKDTE